MKIGLQMWNAVSSVQRLRYRSATRLPASGAVNGQDMDNRGAVAGGLLQLDPHAPKEMLVALLIHHFDPLLSHPTGLRAATLA